MDIFRGMAFRTLALVVPVMLIVAPVGGQGLLTRSSGAGASDSDPALALDPQVGPVGPRLLGESGCNGGEIYDDGTAENGYSGNPSLVSTFEGVQKFTPAAYPLTYSTVCLGLASLAGPNLDFEIEVRDDNGPGGQPGTLLGALPVSATGIPGQLPCTIYEYDISALGISVSGGGVWIGVRWNPMVFPSRFICSDESLTTPLHAGFVNFNLGGGWEATQTVFPAYRALLVRANSGTFELIDVNPELITTGGGISTNVAQLLALGEPRSGLAADGLTPLLLRWELPGPGSVEYSLAGASAPADGGLDVVDGNGRFQSVTVPVLHSSGAFKAVALYRSPDEFDRGGDGSLTERYVNISATYIPSGGGPPQATQRRVKLVRPPVVLLHGLWSSRSTWRAFPLGSDSRFTVVAGDYAGSSAGSFAENATVPLTATLTALERLRREGIAATQVDLVGHSMGGILGRVWVGGAGYLRPENFRRGDIRKLVTLDTPHGGSPLATLLVGFRELPILGNIVELVFDVMGNPIDEGAIDDLVPGSPALLSVSHTPVPAHALVGIGGSDVLELAPGSLGAFYTLVNFFEEQTGGELFEGLQHDFIVGRNSQEGGLSPAAYTLFGGLDGIHVGWPEIGIPGNTGSSLYSNRTAQLLDTLTASLEFEEFPSPGLLLRETAPLELRDARSVSAGLVITSPPPGTLVAPGDQVVVTLEPTGGNTIERVIVFGPGAAVTDEVVPFEVSLPIPLDAVVGYTISALGSNAQGDFFTAPDVHLAIEQTATLESISLLPETPVLFGVGSSLQLTTLGVFSDGIVRDLTDPAAGTVYSTLEPAVASVTPNGLLQAVALGSTEVSAENGSLAASQTVVVTAQPPLVFADGFETGGVSGWSQASP